MSSLQNREGSAYTLPWPRRLQDAAHNNAVIWVLDEDFNSMLSDVSEHLKLHSHIIIPQESFDQCRAQLHDLSGTCVLLCADEMTEDQTAIKTNNPKIHEKFLMEKGLSLDKTTEIAREVKSALHCSK